MNSFFKQTPSGPKPWDKARRMQWWAAKNDLPSHPKWKTVAHVTDSPVGNVVAVVVYINGFANKSHRRGSVEGFSVFECAVTLGYDPAQVQMIFDTLSSEEIGWIDQSFIVSWYEHNPDQSDPTANERQQRHRAKKRAEKAERDALSRVTNGQHGVAVTRDGHALSRVTNVKKLNRNNGHGVTSVTRDVTLHNNTERETGECGTREPVDNVDKSQAPRKPKFGFAPEEIAKGRAETSSGFQDGESDEEAFRAMGINPVLPNPFDALIECFKPLGVTIRRKPNGG